MDIRIDTVVVGEMETNCYIVMCAKTGKTMIIDPGGDYEKIIKAAAGKKIEFVVNTHGHIDHIKEDAKFKTPVYIHALDKDCLTDADKNLSALLGNPATVGSESVLMEDGGKLRLGSAVFDILHTPGHTKGSVSLKTGSILFSGDTLFCGSCGRTDLPGGSEKELFASLKKLMSLPEDTVVYPGHGPCTDIGAEQKFWADL